MWKCWLFGHEPELWHAPGEREGSSLLVVCKRCPAAGTWNDSLVWKTAQTGVESEAHGTHTSQHSAHRAPSAHDRDGGG